MYRNACLFVVLILVIALHPAKVPAEPGDGERAGAVEGEVLLFPFFRGNGEGGVFLAVSLDGLDFRGANYGQAIFTPPKWPGQDLTRDPSIIRHDGMFHMVWTSHWTGRVFGYASSPDLANWSEPKMITPFPATLPEEDQPGNVWAPEIHYDPVQRDFFIVFSSTTPRERNDGDGSADDNDHRLYVVRTTDFKTFTPAEVFFDPGHNVIDAHLVYDDQGNEEPGDDRWVMVYKNESRRMPGKNLWLATRDARMESDWRVMPQPIAGPGAAIAQVNWVEGPSLVRHDNAWLLYWDAYDSGRYALAKSSDLIEWTDLTDQLSMPTRHPRHGTVFKADVESLGLPIPSFTEADRLPNSDFEHANDDKPSAWTTHLWSGRAEHRYLPTAGRDNTAAVAIGSEQGADAAWSVAAPVEPGTRYRLSGWVRTKDLVAGTGRGALINVYGMEQARTQALTGDTPWTKVETTFNSGDRREIQINCLFGGWGESTGLAWYDDISLEPVE